MNKEYGLQINNDVIIKMASVAALEVEGVAALVPKTSEFKEVFTRNTTAKAIKIKQINDSVVLEIFISVNEGFDVKKVAEEVQVNVKTKIQNMTGNVIDKVNVTVADVVFSEEEKPEA